MSGKAATNLEQMTIKSIEIAGRQIGPGQPPYIIAEMSGNHNQDIGRALAIIEAASEAGADALKLQTYTADTMTLDHDGPGFVLEAGPWKGRKLYELFAEAHTPWAWHDKLFAKGRDLGITVFSSPFDETAVDFLEELGAPAFKIASFEVTDLPLIEKVAATGKPMIMSTGMASQAEISEAVEAARGAGAVGPILLHCVSAYPAAIAESNLHRIPNLAETFGVMAGLSDHSLGITAAIAATALGACVIEKHFTLARADGGIDSTFSLEPDELGTLVRSTRDAFAAMGEAQYALTEGETEFTPYRRSLYAVKDIAAGEIFTPENVRVIRPSYGLPPKELVRVLGKHAVHDIKRGEPLEWAMVAP